MSIVTKIFKKIINWFKPKEEVVPVMKPYVPVDMTSSSETLNKIIVEAAKHPTMNTRVIQAQLPLDQYFKTVANGDDFYGDSYNKILCTHYRIRLEDDKYHIDELDYSYSTSNFVSCWYNLVNGFTSHYYPISFCWSRTGTKFDTLEEAENHVVWLTNRRLETYNEHYHKEPVNIVKHYW